MRYGVCVWGGSHRLGRVAAAWSIVEICNDSTCPNNFFFRVHDLHNAFRGCDPRPLVANNLECDLVLKV